MVTRLRRPPEGFTYLRPRMAVFWQTLFATNAFLGPVLIVLYVLTIPDGPWLLVLVMQLIASVLFTAVSAAFFRTGVWVDESGLAERGFFGRLDYYSRDEIARIMLAPTFHGDGTKTLPQLFLCDTEDNKLVRLRGQFWSIETMQQLSDILDMPITELPASELREIHEEYPGLLYWFERRPVIAALIFSAAIVAAGALVYGILMWTGAIPSAA